MEEKDMTYVFESLNNVLSQTNLDDVTSEGSGFEELPDGYYIGEVEKAELKESKSSQQPMVAFQFKVVQDGITDDGNFSPISKTNNRKIFMYYVLKDEQSVKRFVTDMLKFEGEKEGESILGKEYFTNSEVLIDALDILIGSRIYIHISTTERNGQTSTWRNLISWKRAKALGLLQ